MYVLAYIIAAYLLRFLFPCTNVAFSRKRYAQFPFFCLQKIVCVLPLSSAVRSMYAMSTLATSGPAATHRATTVSMTVTTRQTTTTGTGT